MFFCIPLEPFDSLGKTRLQNPSLAFEASTDPVDTLPQAALAPQQTTEESTDTTFVVMSTCQSIHIGLLNRGLTKHCNHAIFVYLTIERQLDP
jgi:hypothetical protein